MVRTKLYGGQLIILSLWFVHYYCTRKVILYTVSTVIIYNQLLSLLENYIEALDNCSLLGKNNKELSHYEELFMLFIINYEQ